MRTWWIFGGLALAALAVAVGWWRSAPPAPNPAESIIALAETPLSGAATDAQPVAGPQPPPSQASTAETRTTETGAAETGAGETAAAPPAASATAAALPELPTRAVGEWRTHVVPEDTSPGPAKPFDVRVPSTGAAPSPPGAGSAQRPPANASSPIGPTFRPFAALHLPSASDQFQPRAGGPPAPPPAPSRTPAPRGAPGPQIAGAATAAGATALRVGGQPLHLFGIRPPANGDRCVVAGTAGAANGAPAHRTLPCIDQAQGTLAARLARKANISCRFPGAARPDGPAICLDGDGVDLAGLLVAEGLALADPAQSYDYVGAEGIARAQKRGLWLFR